MVRLPSKLARSLRPYEAVTSSSLEDNPHFTTSRAAVTADNNNNALRRSSSADTSDVELVANSELSLFENESNAIEVLIETFKPASCVRRRSSVCSSTDDIELALKSSDYPANDDATETISHDEDNSCSSSQTGDTEKVYNKFDDTEQIDPFSINYAGIGASYFSVGLMLGASLSLMYPILVVKGGSSSSFLAASHALIMIFWSYKIFFGFLSDW